MKTLLAFFRRDMTVQLSYKFAFAFDVFSVFFSAATFYFVAKLFGQAAIPALQRYGGNYFAFVLIGIAFATYQNVGLNSFSQSLRQEQFLNTLEPLFLTPVSLPKFLVGAGLWDFFYATLEVVLYLSLGFLLFGLRLPQANLPAAGMILLLTLVAFMGLGVLAAAFILRFKRGNPVTWTVATVSELLGGVYFPTDILPPWLHSLSVLVPMNHALLGLRKSLLLGAGWSDVGPHALALTVFSVVLWPVGIAAFSLALKRARKDGSLGHY
ncbi:MAG TPA: ABC transporter permease [Elusimicrobiota bacterium]|nr:ABC transporter permease [Elusimicrobiota bacterium]